MEQGIVEEVISLDLEPGFRLESQDSRIKSQDKKNRLLSSWFLTLDSVGLTNGKLVFPSNNQGNYQDQYQCATTIDAYFSTR